MADDDDWFGGSDEPEPEEPKSLFKKKAATPPPAKAEEAAPAEAAAAAAAAPEVAEPEGEYLDPDKLLLFKHWIRPKFLQYKYLYDYQQNYYNDVMEVVDRRRKGFRRAIPKPQTWAERILRSRNDPLHKLETFDRYLEDLKLVTRSEISGTFYSYYSKESVNKRFSKLLF